jgi:DNA repair exonuclease SbcCD ATPase subunit
MFNELSIQNFQSHKKTNISFSNGINSIVGISDSGKTAILRALYWAINNRPLGNADISDWNKDDNEESIKSTFVRITTDKGIIERRKGKVKVSDESKKFNGYIVDGNYLEAVGTSVPDIVTKMFNLDEVNFQGQFDPSFLLSNSAGEVARFFNSTIRLDLIDRILSKADSKRLETNKDKKKLEIEQDIINNEIAKFDWLEDAEILIDRIVKIENRIESNNEIKEKLEFQKDAYESSMLIIQEQEVILSAIPIINKIDLIQESLEEKIEKYERLQNLYEEYLEQNQIIGMADFSNAEKLIKQIDELNDKIETKENEYEELKESNEQYLAKYMEKEACEVQIIELEKELPSMCPMCNKPLKGDKCK